MSCDEAGTVNFESDFEEQLMDCGLMADGTCTKAGSEHCDFDCGLLEAEATE